jgi:uncharacterized small protein (DUF1192 family)
MSRRKSSAAAPDAASEEGAAECCAKCESDIAAISKEIADLKKELAKKPAGGADARVDSVIQYLKLRLQERPEGMSRDEYRQKLEKMVRDL